MTWSANVFLLSYFAYLVCENKKLSHILYEILDVNNVNKKPPFFRGILFLREVVFGKEFFFFLMLILSIFSIICSVLYKFREHKLSKKLELEN